MYPRIPCEGISEAHFGNHCKYSTTCLNGSCLFYRLFYRHLGPDVLELTVWQRGSQMSPYHLAEVYGKNSVLCLVPYGLWNRQCCSQSTSECDVSEHFRSDHRNYCRITGATLSLTDTYGAAVAHYTHNARLYLQCKASTHSAMHFLHTHTATRLPFPVCQYCLVRRWYRKRVCVCLCVCVCVCVCVF